MATTTLPPFDRNRRANAGDSVDEVKIMARRLRLLPPFLDGVVTEQAYFRWLARRADAQVRRDRKRFSNGAMGAAYRKAIHEAVLASGGRDDYTGEELDWMLISKYTNPESQVGRHHYKTGFALLPTVDHLDASLSSVSFKLCAWRTNDAKNDMPVGDVAKILNVLHTRQQWPPAPT